MEMGFDAVLINTAIAKAGDPVAMARAFALAVEAGRLGLSRRSDAAARHGRALDAGDRARLHRSRACLIPFYLIVDSAAWIARLLPCGVRLVQLRVKERPVRRSAPRSQRPRRFACDMARSSSSTIIGKHAIDAGCDFVHLGQGDLDTADLTAIRRAGLRLGVSTHDEAELVPALDAAPDYIALGPIYPTILKAMPFAPQGLAAARRNGRNASATCLWSASAGSRWSGSRRA